MNAPRAWDTTVGSASVVVAVLDTGVDFAHGDLADVTVPGYDLVSNDADPADDEGHGTAAAGVVAARANNALGVAGTCWRCALMPVKVLNASGSGTTATVANGIVWATDHGARVINLSLGGTGTTQALADAVAYAASKDVVLVAAAGNSGSTTPFYPAAYPQVLSVAGTDRADALYSWSNRGSWVKVAAPGCNAAPVLGGSYGEFCGTSSATPVVAGLAALARSLDSGATRAEIERAITDAARPISSSVQHGRVDAAGMLASLTADGSAANGTGSVAIAVFPAGDYQGAKQFQVRWAASDAASYDVRYRQAGPGSGFGSYTLWQIGTSSPGAAFTGLTGSTYCFTARATDEAGALGAWSSEACTAVPLDDRALTRKGKWGSRAAAGCYLNSYSFASAAGASLVRRAIQAKALAVVVTRCPGCGTVDVLWRGQRLRRIALNAQTVSRRVVVVIASFASVRTGTATIRVVSSGRPVRIDGLGVSRTG